MRQAHRVVQVRRSEQLLLDVLPDGALMARAALGLAHEVADLLVQRRGVLRGSRVLVVAGSGDNAGDALLAGAWLARRGVTLRWVEVAPAVHLAGASALRAAGGRDLTPDEAAIWECDLALDAVVGIGGRPGLREPARTLFEQVALAGRSIVAVDLPSGVDVDAATTPEPHVRADVTVTFGTHKPALLVDPAASAAGQVRMVDIGLDLSAEPPLLEALDAADVAALLPRPGREAHKYTRGVVGIRAGSATYPGAALLCVAGASTGLAGMVRYVGPEAVRVMVTARHPEVVGVGRVQAWAVGSGGADEAQAALDAALQDAAESTAGNAAETSDEFATKVVVDADALAHLDPEQARGLGQHLLLTPHAGELARMLDVDRATVEAAPLQYVQQAAATFGATVLLKGARTLVATPGRPVRVNTTGTPWLGTAGSGDVLAGLAASLLAAGLAPHDAGSVAAWVHGRAGERAIARGPFVAGDLPHEIRHVLGELLGEGGYSNS